ncbi:MAG: MmcQ/YjbR family DNA-binding protein [Chitinophagaceae bacterium]|nr:MmcQ/YjbR family DNA-binding protein [Chitinophagaceae bacterium]
MIDSNYFRQLALSFPGTAESSHFEKTSFRVNKKIFATLSVDTRIACLKLSAIDQSVFCVYDKMIIYPVPGKWGQQGWTFVELNKVKRAMLKDILTTAYTEVLKRK